LTPWNRRYLGLTRELHWPKPTIAPEFKGSTTKDTNMERINKLLWILGLRVDKRIYQGENIREANH
jgi:hypothetical protein